MSAGRLGRLRIAGVVLVGCLALGLLGAASAVAEETAKLTPSGGSEQTFEVPAGVTQVKVLAVGAAGAGSSKCAELELPSAPGGAGARVGGVLKVLPHQTLYVDFVGGEAGGSDCFGGGQGGNASDVRSANTLGGRLLVAGGGGGGGGLGNTGETDLLGGTGGSASGTTGETGGQASTCIAGPNAHCGEGGEGASTLGGKGGAGGQGEEVCVIFNGETFCSGGNGGSGKAGVTGQAGAGGGARQFCIDGGDFEGPGGGGGGGGYYGGGGGGGGGLPPNFGCEHILGAGGGGGAGSSFVAPEPEGKDASYAVGRNAQGEAEEQRVEISYTPPPTCTTAVGRGVYKRPHEEGRLSLTDNVHKSLSEKQQLVVGNLPAGTTRFYLTKLEEATCTGAAGERVFHGKGKAAKGTEKGYTVTFTIKEQTGGYVFESASHERHRTDRTERRAATAARAARQRLPENPLART